jgi:hypothetical protein
MSTKIEIVNAALAHAGQKSLASLTAQTPEADFIDRIYTVKLKEALALHSWRFAREFVQLNRLAALSVSKSLPQYQLPNDHIRTIGVQVDGVDFFDFEQSKDKLLIGGAGENSVVILEYTTSNISETSLGAHFVPVLALLLGSACALSLARDRELAGDLYSDMSRMALPVARSIDSQQGRTKSLRRSRLTNAHRGG